MNILTVVVLVITLIYIILEIKFKPRLEGFQGDGYYNIVLWYSIKSKFDKHLIVREYIPLFKFKN